MVQIIDRLARCGVDDGGEVRRLTPSGPVTIASDGRPRRVAVGTFRTEWCNPWPPPSDEHGIVRCPVLLQAGTTRTLKLGFSFESGDVRLPDPG